MCAHNPPAAQRARGAIEIRLAKRESCQDPFSFRLELPAAVLIKNMKRIVIGHVVRRRSRPSGCGFVPPDYPLSADKLRGNGESKFEHGLVTRSGGFLRKKSNGGVLLDRDRSLIGRSVAE